MRQKKREKQLNCALLSVFLEREKNEIKYLKKYEDLKEN